MRYILLACCGLMMGCGNHPEPKTYNDGYSDGTMAAQTIIQKRLDADVKLHVGDHIFIKRWNNGQAYWIGDELEIRSVRYPYIWFHNLDNEFWPKDMVKKINLGNIEYAITELKP